MRIYIFFKYIEPVEPPVQPVDPGFFHKTGLTQNPGFKTLHVTFSLEVLKKVLFSCTLIEQLN